MRCNSGETLIQPRPPHGWHALSSGERGMRKDGKEDRKQAPLSSSFLPWRSLSSSFSNLTSAAREGEMGVLSNKIEREQLKPGDHIYSWRSAYIYAHHGASSSSSSSSTNSLVTSPLLALSIGGRSCNRLCYSYCCSCCCYSWLLSQSLVIDR